MPAGVDANDAASQPPNREADLPASMEIEKFGGPLIGRKRPESSANPSHPSQTTLPPEKRRKIDNANLSTTIQAPPAVRRFGNVRTQPQQRFMTEQELLHFVRNNREWTKPMPFVETMKKNTEIRTATGNFDFGRSAAQLALRIASDALTRSQTSNDWASQFDGSASPLVPRIDVLEDAAQGESAVTPDDAGITQEDEGILEVMRTRSEDDEDLEIDELEMETEVDEIAAMNDRKDTVTALASSQSSEPTPGTQTIVGGHIPAQMNYEAQKHMPLIVPSNATMEQRLPGAQSSQTRTSKLLPAPSEDRVLATASLIGAPQISLPLSGLQNDRLLLEGEEMQRIVGIPSTLVPAPDSAATRAGSTPLLPTQKIAGPQPESALSTRPARPPVPDNCENAGSQNAGGDPVREASLGLPSASQRAPQHLSTSPPLTPPNAHANTCVQSVQSTSQISTPASQQPLEKSPVQQVATPYPAPPKELPGDLGPITEQPMIIVATAGLHAEAGQNEELDNTEKSPSLGSNSVDSKKRLSTTARALQKFDLIDLTNLEVGTPITSRGDNTGAYARRSSFDELSDHEIVDQQESAESRRATSAASGFDAARTALQNEVNNQHMGARNDPEDQEMGVGNGDDSDPMMVQDVGDHQEAPQIVAHASNKPPIPIGINGQHSDLEVVYQQLVNNPEAPCNNATAAALMELIFDLRTDSQADPVSLEEDYSKFRSQPPTRNGKPSGSNKDFSEVKHHKDLCIHREVHDLARVLLGFPEQPLRIPSRQDLISFKNDSPGAGPQIQDLVLELANPKSLLTPWNKQAISEFTKEFLRRADTGDYECRDKRKIAKSFEIYLQALQARYRKQITAMSSDDVEKVKEIDRKRKKAADNRRHYKQRRRIAALDPYVHVEGVSALAAQIKRLPRDAMSDDEEENGDDDQLVYVRVHPEWRGQEGDDLMEILEALALAKYFTEDGDPGRGTFPTRRLKSNRQNKGKCPACLPKNVYKASYLEELGTIGKGRLQVKEPFRFEFPAELLREAERYRTAVSRDLRPLPRDHPRVKMYTRPGTSLIPLPRLRNSELSAT